jgi:hypothetical protein
MFIIGQSLGRHRWVGTLVPIRISPQSRKGRGEIIFYLAVRGRQIKRSYLQKMRAADKQNHLFPKGWDF